MVVGDITMLAHVTQYLVPEALEIVVVMCEGTRHFPMAVSGNKMASISAQVVENIERGDSTNISQAVMFQV
jgi:hypothetical protein